MKRLLLVFTALMGLYSCGQVKVTPTSNTVYKEVVKDSIIYVKIPVEKIIMTVPQVDTLEMETSVAKSISYLDTNTLTLKGKLENKSVKIEKEIQYITIENQVIKEVPTEVIVEKVVYPKIFWIMLIIVVLELIYFGVKLYIKIKK